MHRGEAIAAGRCKGESCADRRTGEAHLRYLSSIRRFFARRVSAHDVDDMVQNVVLRIEQRGAQETIDNVEGYAARVAHSVLADHQRRDRSHLADRHQPLEEWNHPVEEISPDRIAEGRDELEKVVGALQSLPPRTRQAFILHRFDHLPYAAIAAQMGISVSAVEKHMMRAIRQLSVMLGDG